MANQADEMEMKQQNDFNDEQLLQYSRQIMLPDFGIEGQQALLNSHVVIIGLGGLGSPSSMYLTTAGVGRITLVDFDVVEHSNLQRQIAHNTDSLGINKAESAAQTLSKLNPGINIHCITHRANESELGEIIHHADCVLDGTDNFATRFLINRVCFNHGIPLISAAAIQYEGHISVFDFRDAESACYACLYPEGGEENNNCSENGILAPVVGIIGSIQALEAIKLLTGRGETLSNRLMVFDALTMQWRTLKLKKDHLCPVCQA